jgi:hypothetical protein
MKQLIVKIVKQSILEEKSIFSQSQTQILPAMAALPALVIKLSLLDGVIDALLFQTSIFELPIEPLLLNARLLQIFLIDLRLFSFYFLALIVFSVAQPGTGRG